MATTQLPQEFIDELDALNRRYWESMQDTQVLHDYEFEDQPTQGTDHLGLSYPLSSLTKDVKALVKEHGLENFIRGDNGQYLDLGPATTSIANSTNIAGGGTTFFPGQTEYTPPSYDYTLQREVGSSIFNNPVVGIVAAALAPITGGLSVAALQGLRALDGETLGLEDYAAVVTSLAGMGIPGADQLPSTVEVAQAAGKEAYDQYKDGGFDSGEQPNIVQDPASTGELDEMGLTPAQRKALEDALEILNPTPPADNRNPVIPPDQQVTPPDNTDPGEGYIFNDDGSRSYEEDMTDPTGQGISMQDIQDMYNDIVNGTNHTGTNPTGSNADTSPPTGGVGAPPGSIDESGATGGNGGFDFNLPGIEDLANIYRDYRTGSDARRNSERALRNVQVQPYNMNMPGFGNTTFDNGQINFSPDERIRQLINQSRSGAVNTLQDPNQNQFIDRSIGFANENIDQAMADAINTESLDPYRDQFSARQEEIFGNLQSNEMLNMLDPERRALLRSGRFQNKFGRDLLENSDFQTLADDRLGLLREQANPYETMQRNDLAESMFTLGQTGSKAGAMREGALGLTQSTADIERQLQAQTMADDMRQFNITAGTDLFAGGTNALGTSGQLFDVGASADARKAQTATGVSGNTLEGEIRATEGENLRKRDVLNDVQGMFNVGQSGRTTQINNASDYYKIFSDIMADQRANVSTAANPGGINTGQAAANANTQTTFGVPASGSAAEERAIEELIRIITGR